MRGAVKISSRQSRNRPGELPAVPAGFLPGGPADVPPCARVPEPNEDEQAFSAPTVRDLSGLPEQVPVVPLSRPRTVAGYEVLGELGRGGMGVVYLARQTALNRLVALKMMLSARTCRKDLERFRSEALAVARLRHPIIVQI